MQNICLFFFLNTTGHSELHMHASCDQPIATPQHSGTHWGLCYLWTQTSAAEKKWWNLSWDNTSEGSYVSYLFRGKITVILLLASQMPLYRKLLIKHLSKLGTRAKLFEKSNKQASE